MMTCDNDVERQVRCGRAVIASLRPRLYFDSHAKNIVLALSPMYSLAMRVSFVNSPNPLD